MPIEIKWVCEHKGCTTEPVVTKREEGKGLIAPAGWYRIAAHCTEGDTGGPLPAGLDGVVRPRHVLERLSWIVNAISQTPRGGEKSYRIALEKWA